MSLGEAGAVGGRVAHFEIVISQSLDAAAVRHLFFFNCELITELKETPAGGESLKDWSS